MIKYYFKIRSKHLLQKYICYLQNPHSARVFKWQLPVGFEPSIHKLRSCPLFVAKYTFTLSYAELPPNSPTCKGSLTWQHVAMGTYRFGTNETSWTSLWVWWTHVHLFKVLVSSVISDFTPIETTWPLNNPHQETVNSTLDLSFIELSTVTESVVNFSNGIIACKVHNPFKIPTNCEAITKIKFNILSETWLISKLPRRITES